MVFWDAPIVFFGMHLSSLSLEPRNDLKWPTVSWKHKHYQISMKACKVYLKVFWGMLNPLPFRMEVIEVNWRQFFCSNSSDHNDLNTTLFSSLLGACYISNLILISAMASASQKTYKRLQVTRPFRGHELARNSNRTKAIDSASQKTWGYLEVSQGILVVGSPKMH